MRIDPAILFEYVPKFIRDGWQVVSGYFYFILFFAHF